MRAGFAPAPGDQLPSGVVLRDLGLREDPRGGLSEIFRQDWDGAPDLRQWNIAWCVSGSLRGMHVHVAHTDYLVVASGRFIFGLLDLRPESPTHRQSALLEFTGGRPQAMIVPPGVLHGFLCVEAGLQVYGMTHTWDPSDDITCRWDDPGLGFAFPVTAPLLSDRDANAGSLAELFATFERSCGGGGKP